MLIEDSSSAVIAKPWMAKTLSGQVHLTKFAIHNDKPVFLITSLDKVYVETLTPTILLERARLCTEKLRNDTAEEVDDVFGEMQTLNRQEKGKAILMALEDHFVPGPKWDDLIMEEGEEDMYYERVLIFRSDSFLWTCKLDKVPEGEALTVLKEQLSIPLIGMLAALTSNDEGVNNQNLIQLTKAIDSTAFASHRRLGPLLATTLNTPRVQSGLTRWAQRRNVGMKVDLKNLDPVVDAYGEEDEDEEVQEVQTPSTSPQSSFQPAPSSQRPARERTLTPLSNPVSGSVTPLGSIATENVDARKTDTGKGEDPLDPKGDYDSDATEPEDNITIDEADTVEEHPSARLAQNTLSDGSDQNRTIDEDEEESVAPIGGFEAQGVTLLSAAPGATSTSASSTSVAEHSTRPNINSGHSKNTGRNQESSSLPVRKKRPATSSTLMSDASRKVAKTARSRTRRHSHEEGGQDSDATEEEEEEGNGSAKEEEGNGTDDVLVDTDGNAIFRGGLRRRTGSSLPLPSPSPIPDSVSPSAPPSTAGLPSTMLSSPSSSLAGRDTTPNATPGRGRGAGISRRGRGRGKKSVW